MSELNRSERAVLLALARASVEDRVEPADRVESKLAELDITDRLGCARNAFVTLKSKSSTDGRETLRGCIGSRSKTVPLYRKVVEVAARAASEDPRFPPVAAAELDRIRIEISVLTPSVPLADIEDLVVGRDGVVLQQGEAGALFLPQVAVEQKWTAEQLLRHLALKAGLGPDDWKGAELRVFEAEVFGE